MSLKEIEAWLGESVPEEYAALSEHMKGEAVTVGDVLLYGLEEIVERNETFQVKTYCPGFIAIGDDGGGKAIVLKLIDACLFIVEHGAMTPECMESIPHRLMPWYEAGCQLPNETVDIELFPTTLVLKNAGSANPMQIAKVLRSNLGLSLTDAVQLAKQNEVVLLSVNDHNFGQARRTCVALEKIGADVLLH